VCVCVCVCVTDSIDEINGHSYYRPASLRRKLISIMPVTAHVVNFLVFISCFQYSGMATKYRLYCSAATRWSSVRRLR